jgi:hypothetical protein
MPKRLMQKDMPDTEMGRRPAFRLVRISAADLALLGMDMQTGREHHSPKGRRRLMSLA